MIYKLVRKSKENKEMLMLAVTLLSTWTLILAIGASLFIKTHFVKSSEYTTTGTVKESLCWQVMSSILNKEVHSHMVSSEIVKALVDSKYKALDLTFNETLRYVFASEKSCKAIIEDKKGLRAFELGLDESYLNTFYYKVVQISERDIQEEL